MSTRIGTVGFTKEHTKIAKGIAILLMVYHHLFVIPERLNNNYVSVINLLGFNFQSILANFAKICVCIFCFCSGIGMYYSLIKSNTLRDMYKKSLIHGLKFMMNFWVILLLIIPIGCGLNYLSLSPKVMLQLFTASYGGVAEWWFVKQYIALLILAPLVVRLFQNKKLIYIIIPICILVIILIIYRIGAHYSLWNSGVLYYIGDVLGYIWNIDCVLVFIVGVICVRYNLIYHYQKYEKHERWTVCLFSAVLSIIIRVSFSNTPTSMNVDFIVVPLFILPLVTVLYNTKMGTVLSFFGNHSTNIWLTHTFWCYYFGQSIVLLPRYSILIFIWLLLLSLLSSYVINLIYVPLSNLIFNREHRWSYKGYLKIGGNN